MTTWGSVESVVAAIQEEARAEIERIDGEAAAAIARLQSQDRERPVVVADADARIESARRRARERAAEENWADRQAALDARQRWMTEVVARALDLLRTADAASRRDDLTRLAHEAVTAVGAPAVEILVALEDVSVADTAWAAELAAATGVTVTVTGAADVAGGCVARTLDRRLTYDNTFAARLRRFEAAWRSALNELIEVRS